jgi:uncharacterized membrane protein YkoI
MENDVKLNKTRKWIIGGGVLVAATVAAGTGIVAATEDDSPPVDGASLDQAVSAALAHTGGGTVTGTETGDDDGAVYEIEITKEDGTQVDVHLDRSFSVISTEDDDRDDDGPDAPIDPAAVDQAIAAALAHTGGGTVTGTESDDGRYEVEITTPDGRRVEVDLDQSFNVVHSEADDGDDD